MAAWAYFRSINFSNSHTKLSEAFHMASLYVGNLHPDCTEATLYQKFSQFGSILNIRICRDVKTGNSLGYGYVNFTEKRDAAKALSSLNYDIVKGRPIRIMWADKNVNHKLPLKANIFVKNLHPVIDDRTLFDIFASYGTIMSLKVATYETGESKGFAFVQYETEEEAEKAIASVNEKLIRGNKVYVSKFVPREKRINEKYPQYRNIYLKNFSFNFKDQDLTDLCKQFGTIVSAKVMTDEDGESKGFGFVCFKDHASAVKAVEELNGKKLQNGQKLFAGRAKKKSERQAEVMEKFKSRLMHIQP